jgi:hypothetical protein
MPAMRGFAHSEKVDRWLHVVGGGVFFVFFGLAGVGIFAKGPRDPARTHAVLQGLSEAPDWQQYLGGVMCLAISLAGLAFAVYWWRRKV